MVGPGFFPLFGERPHINLHITLSDTTLQKTIKCDKKKPNLLLSDQRVVCVKQLSKISQDIFRQKDSSY